MWDANTATRHYCIANNPEFIAELPTVLILGVAPEMGLLRDLEEDCGLAYDDEGVFRKLIELLAIEDQAMRRVQDWLDFKTYRGYGFGQCYESGEFIKCFRYLALCLWTRLRRERLYCHGLLPYEADHMRSSRLILRRLDSIYDIIRQELSADGLYRRDS